MQIKETENCLNMKWEEHAGAKTNRKVIVATTWYVPIFNIAQPPSPPCILITNKTFRSPYGHWVSISSSSGFVRNFNFPEYFTPLLGEVTRRLLPGLDS